MDMDIGLDWRRCQTNPNKRIHAQCTVDQCRMSLMNFHHFRVWISFWFQWTSPNWWWRCGRIHSCPGKSYIECVDTYLKSIHFGLRETGVSYRFVKTSKKRTRPLIFCLKISIESLLSLFFLFRIVSVMNNFRFTCD